MEEELCIKMEENEWEKSKKTKRTCRSEAEMMNINRKQKRIERMK